MRIRGTREKRGFSNRVRRIQSRREDAGCCNAQTAALKAAALHLIRNQVCLVDGAVFFDGFVDQGFEFAAREGDALGVRIVAGEGRAGLRGGR